MGEKKREDSGYFIPASHINDLQRDSIDAMVKVAKGMSMADVLMRKNGADHRFEVDWLKYIIPIDGTTAEAKAGHAWEEYQCVTRCLDHAGIPSEESGRALSLWGRVMRLVEKGMPPASPSTGEACARPEAEQIS